MSPTPNNRDIWNHLRVDLYRHLLGEIQEQDQASGAHGFVMRYDDPESTWDAALLPGSDPLKAKYDAIGLSPEIQELFYVIERMEGEDLAVLESLDALVDPFRCPVEALPQLALSFGYALAQNLSEEQKRLAVSSIFAAYKSIGTFVGFKVFFRLIGFEVINVIPLWKKSVNEASGDYSRTRFEVAHVPAQPIGPSGTSSFAGQLPDAPIVPGTFRVSAGGGVLLRDDEHGNLIGQNGETGVIDYDGGGFRIVLAAPAAANVTAAYDRITEEWPYHAARVDIEVNLSPGGGPIPLIDEEAVSGMLTRLDEVRPVHVLLRSLSLVAELRDEVTPMATDASACSSVLLDHRDPVPSDPLSLGRDFTYMLDAAPGAADDDAFVKEQLDGSGARTEIDHQTDERAEIVCPADVLVINTGGPDLFY